MVRVARNVRDKRILKLIGLFLRAGVSVAGVIEQTREGVPQGGPLSPLLANSLLDDFDTELEKRGHRFARYADDFFVLVKSARAGERVRTSISRCLGRTLKLKVNKEKSRVSRANKAEFLGFTFPGKTIRWTADSYEDFRHNVRKLTSRSRSVSMEARVRQLNQYIRGGWGTTSLGQTLTNFYFHKELGLVSYPCGLYVNTFTSEPRNLTFSRCLQIFHH